MSPISSPQLALTNPHINRMAKGLKIENPQPLNTGVQKACRQAYDYYLRGIICGKGRLQNRLGTNTNSGTLSNARGLATLSFTAYAASSFPVKTRDWNNLLPSNVETSPFGVLKTSLLTVSPETKPPRVLAFWISMCVCVFNLSHFYHWVHELRACVLQYGVWDEEEEAIHTATLMLFHIPTGSVHSWCASHTPFATHPRIPPFPSCLWGKIGETCHCPARRWLSRMWHKSHCRSSGPFISGSWWFGWFP